MTPQHTRLAALGIATLLMLATLAVPVAAQSGTNLVDDLFASDEDGEEPSFVDDPVGFLLDTDTLRGMVSGLSERASYQASRSVPWSDPPENDLDTERNATIEAINADSDTLATYLTEKTTLSESQVHAVRLVDEDADAQSMFYVELTYNETSEAFESVEATVDQPADTTVDHEHLIKAQLAENLSEEVETFITEYVATGTLVLEDGRYVSRMATQYGGIGSNIQSTMLNDDFEGFDDGGDDQ